MARLLTALMAFLLATGTALAQKPAREPKLAKAASATSPATLPSEAEKRRAELEAAVEEYKKSLDKLIGFYEADVQRAADRRIKMKELFDAGVISRIEFEETERLVTDAQAKLDEARLRLAEAGDLLAEVAVPAETTRPARTKSGSLLIATAYIRYSGASGFALSNAGMLKAFFAEKFGRQLPIAVLGQSDLHNRWGLDHRNAMDLSVHPDSAEGQALMAFMRANGIPFTAFRGAVAYSSTGPHIHVGLPSHRYIPKESLR